MLLYRILTFVLAFLVSKYIYKKRSHNLLYNKYKVLPQDVWVAKEGKLRLEPRYEANCFCKKKKKKKT